MVNIDLVVKGAALSVMAAVAVAVLFLAPASLRLFLALLALPFETLILTSLLQGSPRRASQV